MYKHLIAAAVLGLASSAYAQSSTNGPAGGKPIAEKSFWSMPSGPIAYPGNTWGTLVYGVKTPEGDTVPQWRIEGIVEQGIVWKQFDNGWKLNTFGAVEYVLNSDSSGYTPVLGVKMQKSFGGDGALDLGVRYKYGNTFLSATSSGSFAGGEKKVGRVEVYATYWFAWDMKR